jgi:hypothetical protein
MAKASAITTRRLLEQVAHCIQEARSVLENDEEKECALDDLNQAVALLTQEVIPRVKRMHALPGMGT